MIDAIFDRINYILPAKWRSALSHAGFRRYFKNTGWMFFGQAFSVLSVLVGIWIARYLGPSDFGLISYIFAYVGIFSFIPNLGINSLLIRDLVKFPEKRDALMGTGFALNLIGGSAALLLTVGTSLISHQSPYTLFLIAVWSTSFIFGSVAVVGSFFQARVEADKNIKAQILVVLSSSLLKVLLIVLRGGIEALLAIYLFDYIFAGILYFYNYRRSGLRVSRWSFDRGIAVSYLRVSWLLMLSSAVTYIYMKIDQVMIKFYIDSVAVGLYAAAIKFTEIWYFIPTLICSSLFPAIVSSKERSESVYRRRLNRLYWLLLILAVIIAIPVSALATRLIGGFFGAQYIGAVPILRLYVWSSIGLFLSIGINQYLIMENRLRYLFLLNFISMLANVFLNIILIPRLGLDGAAWATLISYTLGPVIFFIFKNIKRNNYGFERTSAGS